MLAELNELFINVQTVSHCILLILDTIKTCRIYHANEQLQSQIVCKNEVTRRGHVIRRSVSTFLGSTNCLLIIRCLSKLSVCMTYVITFFARIRNLNLFPHINNAVLICKWSLQWNCPHFLIPSSTGKSAVFSDQSEQRKTCWLEYNSASDIWLTATHWLRPTRPYHKFNPLSSAIFEQASRIVNKTQGRESLLAANLYLYGSQEGFLPTRTMPVDWILQKYKIQHQLPCDGDKLE